MSCPKCGKEIETAEHCDLCRFVMYGIKPDGTRTILHVGPRPDMCVWGNAVMWGYIAVDTVDRSSRKSLQPDFTVEGRDENGAALISSEWGTTG